jgi:ribosome-binding ATPase
LNVVLTGLPMSGKTCLFDALCKGAVNSAESPARADHPNAAMIEVPDPRLDWLSEHYQTKKRTPVQMEWMDLPGLAPGQADLKSQNTAVTEYLRRADALVCVLRAFESSRLPGAVDPRNDRSRLRSEFGISDLETTLRRIEKLEKQVTKPIADREAMKKELEFLARCREALEAEQPLHGVARTDVERGILRGFASLTEKPMVTVLNVSEDAAGTADAVAAKHTDLGSPLVALCASLEAEIAKLPAEERPTFIADMGLDRLRAPDVILAVYAALNRITYFTAGEKEVASRSIVRGTCAPEAAGEVHTDIAKGFIRAEIVSYEDFRRSGSLKQAKADGHVKSEGRDYVVQDGDIMLFHFSR